MSAHGWYVEGDTAVANDPLHPPLVGPKGFPYAMAYRDNTAQWAVGICRFRTLKAARGWVQALGGGVYIVRIEAIDYAPRAEDLASLGNGR